MNTIRIICSFLLSLVQALFPRGLKGRHSRQGTPVAGADSATVASAETDGGGAGGHRSDPVDHPSGQPAGTAGTDTGQSPPTAGNLLGWFLIAAAALRLFC